MVARLRELSTGRVWELSSDPKNNAGEWRGSTWWRYRINRKSSADVTLSYPGISKHHGGVDFREGHWWANDGGSINTVTVNDSPIKQCGESTIVDGDVLGFDQVRLRFETDGDGPSPPSQDDAS